MINTFNKQNKEFGTLIRDDDLEINVRINPDTNQMDIAICISGTLVVYCSKAYSYRTDIGDKYTVSISREVKTDEIHIDIKKSTVYIIK